MTRCQFELERTDLVGLAWSRAWGSNHTGREGDAIFLLRRRHTKSRLRPAARSNRAVVAPRGFVRFKGRCRGHTICSAPRGFARGPQDSPRVFEDPPLMGQAHRGRRLNVGESKRFGVFGQQRRPNRGVNKRARI